MKQILCSLVTMLFLYSCNNPKKNIITTEFTDTYRSGFGVWEAISVTKKVELISFTASQLPLPYYVEHNEPSISDEKLKKSLLGLKNSRIITFKFQEEKGQDLLGAAFTEKDYKSSVEYLSFKIQNDFYINTESVSNIKCVGVHFERTFNVNPYKKIMLYFENVPEQEEIELVYQDKLYKSGKLTFQLKHKPIKL